MMMNGQSNTAPTRATPTRKGKDGIKYTSTFKNNNNDNGIPFN
jgi:hypothetical protein